MQNYIRKYFNSKFGLVWNQYKQPEKDYKVDVFLRMSWVDPRLKYNGSSNRNITLLPALLDDIWMPDIFFTNAKHAFNHNVVKQSMNVEKML